jgi:hypothetical protein
VNTSIGHSQVVTTNNDNNLKITVTITHKIKSSPSDCLVVAWILSFISADLTQQQQEGQLSASPVMEMKYCDVTPQSRNM